MAGVSKAKQSKEERTGVRYEAIFLTTSRTEYRWPFGFEANCVVRGIVYWYDVDNWRFNGSQHHWFMKINAGRINCPLSSRAEDCVIKAELYLTLHVYSIRALYGIFTYCFVVLVMDIKPVSPAALTLISITLIKDRGDDRASGCTGTNLGRLSR